MAIIGDGHVGQAAFVITSKVAKCVLVAVESKPFKDKLQQKNSELKDNIFPIDNVYPAVLRKTKGLGKI